MNPRSFTLLLAVVSFLLTGHATAREKTGPKLKVMTSFLPMQAHAVAITGDDAQVEPLFPRDVSPHDYQLTPAIVARLARADVLVINGAGMEGWLQELVRNVGSPTLVVIDCSAGIETTEGPACLHHGSTGPSVQHRHPPGGRNPHIWLDPVIARKQVAIILAALQKADPDRRAAYADRAAKYDAQIRLLHLEYVAVLSALPNKNLVTFHDAFPYLASRYGLNYIGYVSEFPEKDPKPQQLADLVDKIRAHKIGVIFAEKGYETRLLQEIGRQTSSRVASLDTLEIGAGEADSYLVRMRANLRSLEEAFRASPR
jgi:ABC-type Zn uptake system ZnuABC Zn-binding protein ZnuA